MTGDRGGAACLMGIVAIVASSVAVVTAAGIFPADVRVAIQASGFGGGETVIGMAAADRRVTGRTADPGMSGGVEGGLVDHKGGAHGVGITVTALAVATL